MLELKRLLEKTKRTTIELGQLSPAVKKKVLLSLKKILKDNYIEIFTENKKDIENARKNGKNAAFIDRLTFTDKNFQTMVESLSEIADLDDSLGEIIEKRTIPNGVELQKIRVPLGVIGIIYESRPNITVEVFALCLKSGNACVLKGGSDAINSNRILFQCIQNALEENNLSKEIVLFLDTTDRAVVTQLLKENDYIDVIIPRGGYDLVKKVVTESEIPVLYHAAGGARIYIDESADLKMALDICVNAKTSRPATCNSLDTVLIHEKIAKAFLPDLAAKLKEKNVTLKADAATRNIIDAEAATEKDFQTEFLDFIICMKVVKNVDEAINFINEYTKRHSEGIVAQDKKVIDKFINSIDAAALFVNCSTRLHDGGVMGFGAEMGIATGKLHARGPVALKELTTYKWIAYGKGQIRE